MDATARISIEGVTCTSMTRLDSTIMKTLIRKHADSQPIGVLGTITDAFHWMDRFAHIHFKDKEYLITPEELGKIHRDWNKRAKTPIELRYYNSRQLGMYFDTNDHNSKIPWFLRNVIVLEYYGFCYRSGYISENDIGACTMDRLRLEALMYFVLEHERRHRSQTPVMYHIDRMMKYRYSILEWDANVHALLSSHFNRHNVFSDEELLWLSRPRVFPQGVIYSYNQNVVYCQDGWYLISEEK